MCWIWSSVFGHSCCAGVLGRRGLELVRDVPTITRLTTRWQDDAHRFADRDPSSVDYVYLWADGVHLNVRLDEEKLCLLVMIGVRVDGMKELVALADGYRESTRLVVRPAA